MARALFLNDTSNWYHWGCTGTSLAIKSRLSEKGYETLSLPINFPSTVACVPDMLNQYDDKQFYAQACAENAGLFGALEEADLVIVNGEGTMHHLGQIVSRLLYICNVSKLYMNKSVQIINHSAYPEVLSRPTSSVNFSVYNAVYSRMDYIAIREHISHKLMTELGIGCTLAFDCLPLTIKPMLGRLSSAKDGNVVIAGSVSITENGVIELSRYIKELNSHGVQVDVLTGAADFPSRDDMVFIDSLKELDCEWRHVEAGSLEKWLQIIASANVLVSGRFHHTIAAAFLRTPFIVLGSNTPKNHALVETFKTDPLLFHDKGGLHNELLDLTCELWGSEPVDPMLLQSLEERALRNFDYI